MHPFEKLMAKKKKEGKSLSDTEKEAKTSVLDNLMNEMDAHDGQKLGGMKKVTVAAPDKKGLDLGLKKASEIVKGEDMMSDHMDEMESDESEEDEKSEEQKIAELEEKVRQLQEQLASK